MFLTNDIPVLFRDVSVSPAVDHHLVLASHDNCSFPQFLREVGSNASQYSPGMCKEQFVRNFQGKTGCVQVREKSLYLTISQLPSLESGCV